MLSMADEVKRASDDVPGIYVPRQYWDRFIFKLPGTDNDINSRVRRMQHFQSDNTFSYLQDAYSYF